MSCNSFLHLTFEDGLKNPAAMYLGAAACSLPNPRWLEGGGFLSSCLLCWRRLSNEDLQPHKITRGKVSFHGPRKAALDGERTGDPDAGLFWWLVPPSLRHIFWALLTCVHVNTLACPSQQIPIGHEQVHVPKWGLTHMTFPPPEIESWPLCETKQYAFLPRTTTDLQVVTWHSLAERGSRRRRWGQRVRLQFMKSGSGHALFQNPRLLTPFSNVCHVTLSIRIYSHTVRFISFKEPTKNVWHLEKMYIAKF